MPGGQQRLVQIRHSRGDLRPGSATPDDCDHYAAVPPFTRGTSVGFCDTATPPTFARNQPFHRERLPSGHLTPEPEMALVVARDLDVPSMREFALEKALNPRPQACGRGRARCDH